jgi:hypothetical protein
MNKTDLVEIMSRRTTRLIILSVFSVEAMMVFIVSLLTEKAEQ